MGSSLRSEHHNCQLGKSTWAMWACLLLGVLGSAAAKTIFPVPEPYRWDETFTVEFPQMDDEHRGLFTTIRDNKHDIADHRLRHLGLMNTVKGAQIPITEEMTDFIKNWLAQHIKNTDFTYKGLLPEIHPIPAPFKWNAFFAVYYPEMDEEHKVLFSCLAEVEQSPSDDALLASCLKSYEDHFVKET